MSIEIKPMGSYFETDSKGDLKDIIEGIGRWIVKEKEKFF
jgi:hypothetical protein